MTRTRHLPSLRMVLISTLFSASLTVVGLSLVSDRIVALSTPEAPPAPTQSAAERMVVVQRGDSLSLIAARELGSTERWRELFAANRDRLSSPSELEVGTTLRLP